MTWYKLLADFRVKHHFVLRNNRAEALVDMLKIALLLGVVCAVYGHHCAVSFLHSLHPNKIGAVYTN